VPLPDELLPAVGGPPPLDTPLPEVPDVPLPDGGPPPLDTPLPEEPLPEGGPPPLDTPLPEEPLPLGWLAGGLVCVGGGVVWVGGGVEWVGVGVTAGVCVTVGGGLALDTVWLL